MIEPKEVTIETQAGEPRVFVLSKFPAVQGREIIAGYPLTAIPKFGEYKANEEIMLKLMTFVAVPRSDGEPMRLTTRALVDNHVPDWETLARVEMAMMEYNCSFFGKGRNSGFFGGIAQKAQALITSTLTDLLRQSSQAGKPPSTN